MTRTVLLTGFEPFGGATVNPSWEAVKRLDGDVWDVGNAEMTVHAREIPCVFGTAADVLDEAIHQLDPELVIAVGQAGGRSALSMERVAINIDDARIPDNAGNQPVDVPVIPGGPAAYFSTLPIKAMVAAVTDAGIPAEISRTAGTFVCNHLFYRLMDLLSREHLPIRAGFVHVPSTPDQTTDTALPSLGLDQIVDGLRIAVRTAACTDHDLPLVGGALH